MSIDSKQIEYAAQIIKNGGLVAFPTETVYGLGADALNPNAVAKIFAEKERPTFDPLIIHVGSVGDIDKYTNPQNEYPYLLAKHFWPGPLTMVLNKKEMIPDIVTSGLPTVGIRMPDNEIALSLIRYAERPIAAPSANKFGRISPTTAYHVRKQLPDLPCILDGGHTQIGIESTVVTFNDDGFIILRQGFITESDLLEFVPKSKNEIKKSDQLESPGMLNSHYSPRKPLFILGEKTTLDIDKSKAALISFSGENTEGYKYVELLTTTRDLKEAAVNLFRIMHQFEDADVDCIVAEPVPQEGIGNAIMDKLHKAAYQYQTSKR